ncbi:general secretion pathway protein A [Marinobacter persicus]|uniref:General secretion pathway protein A n=1 Tax=Marinobacter persicus TaxID=930118 RepID=A0A1I3TV39_9GAMM|nr:AAA family ATPase [Marinobacter persicus]GHD45764.1 ATPase AAA [Marinobacter persicus]SFJ74353.1 general secretion pathway protein A [Marinobacter persicus]
MYYDFFGFREAPFSIAPDPRYLYLSGRHKEALAHLMYGVQGQGGFIVITGEVGTGKTTVCRCFIENAPEHVDIALVLNPRLSARELLSSICDELGIDHSPDASIKLLVDAINQDLLKAHAEGRHKVLVIDEAQNLSADVLEQLRLLTNLETAEKKLLQIVLLGQPELQRLLALPELRQLNQRVTARYHLDALERAELPEYLHYRLSVAGLRGEVFTRGGIRQLYRASGGIPRLINLIADRALLGAYAEGERRVGKAQIRQAAREVLGGAGPGRIGGHGLLVAASVVLAVLATGWLAMEQSPGLPGVASLVPPALSPAGEATVEPTGESTPEPPAPQALPDLELARHTLDRAAAFQQLFQVWGREFDAAAGGLACDHAREVGLSCLEQRGSRRSLEFLDRPVILTLEMPRGEPRYAVLRSLKGERAVLATQSGPREVSFEQLERHWFGNFLLLWRPPEYVDSDNLYTDSTEQELWLGARMMQLAEKLAGTDTEIARIKALPVDQQVQWYQQQSGLTVDGIPGARTLIRINNDLAADVPTLQGEG